MPGNEIRTKDSYFWSWKKQDYEIRLSFQSRPLAVLDHRSSKNPTLILFNKLETFQEKFSNYAKFIGQQRLEKKWIVPEFLHEKENKHQD